MAKVTVRADDVELDRPTMIEGLPGLGLVGKIATDHVVDAFDMTYYASVECEGLPRISVYEENDRSIRPPVRLYADEERDLLALQSDVPVSASSSSEFADCLTGWLADRAVTPLYLSGHPSEKQSESVPSLYGIATGDGGRLLDEHDVDFPKENGAVSGPTGALLSRAGDAGLDAVGLIVGADPKFPDPEAANVLIERGIAPLTGVEVSTDDLVERAEEIREQKEQLAQRMQEAGSDESSQAQPLRMYQ